MVGTSLIQDFLDRDCGFFKEIYEFLGPMMGTELSQRFAGHFVYENLWVVKAHGGH